MARLLILILLLGNALYFAGASGLLRSLGWAEAAQSEPQRLAQQIRPDALRVLSAEEARRQELRAQQLAQARPPECLLAGSFDVPQLPALQAALAGWPAGSWTLEQVVEPARWIVYMGRYANAEAVQRKKAELKGLSIGSEPVRNPSLEPGLSLGGYATQAQATTELANLSRRGVRTARVVQERAEQRGHVLRLPVVDEALKPRLETLRPALAGRSWRPCR